MEKQELVNTLIEQLNMTHHSILHCSRLNRHVLPQTLRGLVLEHGVGRYGAKLPRGVRRRAPKLCFNHATDLVMRHPDRFIYMEGYGVRDELGIVVGEHAWVLDLKHKWAVVDRTWPNPQNGVYLGIPFSYKYLAETIISKKTYGLLDNYEMGWPLLTEDPSNFLHPLASEIPPDFTVGELPDLSVMFDRLKPEEENVS